MYVVTIETSQPMQAMHIYLHSYQGNVKNCASCHLVADCGTMTWECDIWIGWTDTIKV